MKMTLILAATSLALSGCTLSPKLAGFFGTNDPCAAGAAIHAGFVTIAASNAKVAKFAKAERAGYAAFKAQCSDGAIDKVTLGKALDAYSAAVAEWKS